VGTTDWLRSWLFLISRRWILFGVAVVVMGYGAWWLGEWQFDRLEDRRDRNAIIEANEQLPPVPVNEVLSPGGAVDAEVEWRVITATGT
jgi:cytochrome oxidase assembly protein ShyY1